MNTHRHCFHKDDKCEDTSASKKQKQVKKASLPYKARVIITADSTSTRVIPSATDLAEGIMDRLKKCFVRANHPDTPQAEARTALYLAARLMKMYNVTTAEVLAHEALEDHRNYAGSSTVAIQRSDGNKCKKVRQSNYIATLCVAMETFFGCKSYTTSGRSLKITFYGVAENTVAAASALETVYNLILKWASPYRGQSGKNSYCYGVSYELLAIAKQEQREEASRLAEEQAADRAKLERLQEPYSSAKEEEHAQAKTITKTQEPLELSVHSSLVDLREMYPFSPDSHADEDEHDGVTPAPEPQQHNSLPVRRIDLCTSMNAKESVTHDTVRANADVLVLPSWNSSMQLTRFRESTEKIATDWLKDQGKKLHRGRKRTGVKDWIAFRQGQKDSKKIDVRRKRIQN